MKYTIVNFFMLVQLLSSSMYASDVLRAKFQDEVMNFPQGDVCDVEYIQSILQYMYHVDQEARAEYLKDLQIHGVVDRDAQSNEIGLLMNQIGVFHSNIMKQILAVHGWVNISKFGELADSQAWILIQHIEDPFFQAGCLFLLTDLVEKGETDAKNYAYLYDRVSLNFAALGIKQRFGTQFMITVDKEIVLYPYEGTEQELDARREKMGLTQSIAEYIELIKTVYQI